MRTPEASIQEVDHYMLMALIKDTGTVLHSITLVKKTKNEKKRTELNKTEIKEK